ncbi:MAG: hypothetical protein RIS78_811, partial [Bacteroidota bacterium]
MKTLFFSPSRLLFLGLVLALASGLVQPALAQGPRLGHINSGELV